MAIATGPEYDITVWEDQERVSAGSAPMSMSNSDSDSDSEDGMFGSASQPTRLLMIALLEISRLARIDEEPSDEEQEEDDKENELPVVMPRRIVVSERENQRRRSRFERDFQRTDMTRARPSPSPSRSLIFASTNSPLRNMSQSREMSQNGAASNENGVGPHPSFIQVANPYIFQQQLQNSLNALGATEHKEDSIRLQGVHYIDSVRKALQL
jgi:hypothetical protein